MGNNNAVSSEMRVNEGVYFRAKHNKGTCTYYAQITYTNYE